MITAKTNIVYIFYEHVLIFFVFNVYSLLVDRPSSNHGSFFYVLKDLTQSNCRARSTRLSDRISSTTRRRPGFTVWSGFNRPRSAVAFARESEFASISHRSLPERFRRDGGRSRQKRVDRYPHVCERYFIHAAGSRRRTRDREGETTVYFTKNTQS